MPDTSTPNANANANANVIVLDASVLIAHLDRADAHHERARKLLRATADQPLAISPVTLAEVLVGPARTGQLDAALAAVDLLEVTTLALPADAAVRLAIMRAETDLKLPDCFVLLAGDEAGPDARIATFDKALGFVAARRGRVVHGLI